jgi:hypothetical protein
MINDVDGRVALGLLLRIYDDDEEEDSRSSLPVFMVVYTCPDLVSQRPGWLAQYVPVVLLKIKTISDSHTRGVHHSPILTAALLVSAP